MFRFTIPTDYSATFYCWWVNVPYWFLTIKFISATKLGDEVLGIVKIQKKTSSMIFLTCQLECKRKVVATASGIWKILSKPIKKAGYGG